MGVDPGALLAFAEVPCYPARWQARRGLSQNAMSIASFVMKSPHLTSLLALAASTFLTVSAAAQVSRSVAATPASATKQMRSDGPIVGVIDVSAIVDQYPAYIQKRAELDKRAGEIQEQLKVIDDEIEQLRMTVNTMAQDAPQRANLEFQYKVALQNRDFQRKNASDKFGLQEIRMMLEIYEDIDYAVAKVASKRGVALVLPKSDMPPSATPIAELSTRELELRFGFFGRRTVWFASKELDLTSTVIKFMQDPLPDRNSPERAPKKPPAGARSPSLSDPSSGGRKED